MFIKTKFSDHVVDIDRLACAFRMREGQGFVFLDYVAFLHRRVLLKSWAFSLEFREVFFSVTLF